MKCDMITSIIVHEGFPIMNRECDEPATTLVHFKCMKDMTMDARNWYCADHACVVEERLRSEQLGKDVRLFAQQDRNIFSVRYIYPEGHSFFTYEVTPMFNQA